MIDPPIVAVVGGASLAASDADAGIEVRHLSAEHANACLDNIAYLVLDTEDRDADRLLDAADLHHVPVALIVDRLTLEVLARRVLSHQCVDMPLERSLIPSVHELLARVAPRSIPDGPLFEIGAITKMPGNPDDYERMRAISLASPAMRGFYRNFRDAVVSMTRPDTPLLPWQPTDAATSVARPAEAEYKWRLERNPKFPPPLSDIYRCHDDDDVRKSYLRNEPGDDPASGTGWERVPKALLIEGPSGTGKTLVAGLAHELLCPQRREEPLRQLVTVNCGGMDANTFEHRLWGAVPGRWTGVGASPGLAARAAYGTLFLDEIGDTPMDAQARLLHFVQDRMVRPDGMTPFFGFVQVIAATNQPLDAHVAARRFRHDLLARFTARVRLPPLSRRSPNELKQLIDFVAQDPNYNPPEDPTNDGSRRLVTAIHTQAMDMLLAHPYADGNFRELEQVVSNAINRARRRRSQVVLAEDVRLPVARYSPEDRPDLVAVESFQLELPTVRVRRPGDLEKIARNSSVPLLQAPDTSLGAVAGGVLYLYDLSEEEANDSGGGSASQAETRTAPEVSGR